MCKMDRRDLHTRGACRGQEEREATHDPGPLQHWHNGETCGMCHNISLGAQVAREMIEAGEYEDVVSKWSEASRRRWEQSKFCKLRQDELLAVVTRIKRSRTGDGSLEGQVLARTHGSNETVATQGGE